jgi:hypothetical protein
VLDRYESSQRSKKNGSRWITDECFDCSTKTNGSIECKSVELRQMLPLILLGPLPRSECRLCCDVIRASSRSNQRSCDRPNQSQVMPRTRNRGTSLLDAVKLPASHVCHSLLQFYTGCVHPHGSRPPRCGHGPNTLSPAPQFPPSPSQLPNHEQPRRRARQQLPERASSRHLAGAVKRRLRRRRSRISVTT